MKRPNPLNPVHMRPLERRAELCGLLALGLIRLRIGDTAQVSVEHGESSLHSPPEQSAHATPTHRRNA